MQAVLSGNRYQRFISSCCPEHVSAMPSGGARRKRIALVWPMAICRLAAPSRKTSSGASGGGDGKLPSPVASSPDGAASSAAAKQIDNAGHGHPNETRMVRLLLAHEQHGS